MWIGVAAAAAAAAAGAALWMAAEARRVRIVKEEVELDRLPHSFDGLRIFFVTDLHRRELPADFPERVKALGGADIVILGGDIREKDVPPVRTRANIRRLAAIAPVYAVYGNHDYYSGIRELDVLLREEGVRVLVNESVQLEQRDGAVLRLAGVDDVKYGRPDFRRALTPDPELVAVGASAPASAAPCTILVSHDPIVALRRAELRGVDLLLAGHTHGGQIALPFVGPLYRGRSVQLFPRGWFPVVSDNRTTGDTGPRLFVSCGFGTSRVPLRLCAPAESHLFIVRAARRQQPASRS